MREPLITDEDVERLRRGLQLYNAGEFDAIEEYFHPDVVVERVGNLPPLRGWQELRDNFEPDAFESQQLELVDWVINGNRALIRVVIRSRGAVSGLELETGGWMVYSIDESKRVTYLANFVEEAEARAAAGLGQNASP